MKTKSIVPLMAFFFLSNVCFSQQSNQEETKESRNAWLAQTAYLHDDFDEAKSLVDWNNFAIVEGWPDRIAKLEVRVQAHILLGHGLPACPCATASATSTTSNSAP